MNNFFLFSLFLSVSVVSGMQRIPKVMQRIPKVAQKTPEFSIGKYIRQGNFYSSPVYNQPPLSLYNLSNKSFASSSMPVSSFGDTASNYLTLSGDEFTLHCKTSSKEGGPEVTKDLSDLYALFKEFIASQDNDAHELLTLLCERFAYLINPEKTRPHTIPWKTYVPKYGSNAFTLTYGIDFMRMLKEDLASITKHLIGNIMERDDFSNTELGNIYSKLTKYNAEDIKKVRQIILSRDKQAIEQKRLKDNTYKKTESIYAAYERVWEEENRIEYNKIQNTPHLKELYGILNSELIKAFNKKTNYVSLKYLEILKAMAQTINELNKENVIGVHKIINEPRAIDEYDESYDYAITGLKAGLINAFTSMPLL